MARAVAPILPGCSGSTSTIRSSLVKFNRFGYRCQLKISLLWHRSISISDAPLKPLINTAFRAAHSVRETLLVHLSKAPGCSPTQHTLAEFGRRVNSIAFNQIEQVLTKSYPDANVVDTSDISNLDSNTTSWFVQAISSNHNFVRGINQFCTTIGIGTLASLEHAVIVDHVSDTEYYVSSTEKSYSPLGTMRISDSHDLKKATVALHGVSPEHRRLLQDQCTFFRESGCFPLDLISLGCKRVDILCADELSDFQIGLANLFIPSFSAVLGDWTGGVRIKQRQELLASNSQLFRELVRSNQKSQHS